MNFDYNSTRPKLILAEYGRNVQNMVNYICSLPTKEERNRHAQVVIDMMGVLNPHLRDVADFKHKLWDHLQIISEFSIDVDAPYPIATPEEVKHKPELLEYPQHKIKYKHYGFTIEKMIAKAMAVSEADRRTQMTISIANFMKMAYMTWNKDSVSDESIFEDLKELSAGVLQLDSSVTLTKFDFKTPPPGSRTKGGQSGSGTAAPQQHSKSGGHSGGYQKRSSGGYSNTNNNSNPRRNTNNNTNNSNYKRG